MEMLGRINGLFIIVLLFLSAAAAHANYVGKPKVETKTCPNKNCPCFLKKITCPAECPSTSPKIPRLKFAISTVIHPYAKQSAKSANQTAMPPEQDAMIPASLAETASFSTSMAKATSISA
ncbi:hypothetical protein SLA2020_486450 [Shorea laevis]